MNAVYTETTRQGGAELALVQQATTYLEEILASSAFADQVRAEWDRGQDPKGRTLYTLRLSAWGESVSASFTPRDLRDRREVRWSLRGLWDDLLRLRIEQSLKNLFEGSDGKVRNTILNTVYSETTRQGDAELALLHQATAYLEEILGSSVFPDEVRAEWERGQDAKGRTLYTLRLSERTESVSASFTPRELRDRRELRYRLIRLWGDLLQIISHKQLENLIKGSDGA